jgi:hypothetical protein
VHSKDKKKLKEALVEETLDFHPIKGWLRFDAHSSGKRILVRPMGLS